MIYVHIPFCRSFCTYCGFYSELAQGRQDNSNLYLSYSKAVISEIESRRQEIIDSSNFNTLYIGGGTPSVFPLLYLEDIVKALGQNDYDEFTIEVNPEDIIEKGPSYVQSLQVLGVNRISMGVQSFDDCMLKWMNRRHDSKRAKDAFRIIRESGIENLSIDLIFGLSGMTEESWRKTIYDAIHIGDDCGGKPQHISAYQLSIESGSALEKMIESGHYVEASEEECSRQYSILCEMLSEYGYNHYEISNFAQAGYEAKHNSAYWKRVPYVGLGAGAHSFDGNLRRWNSELSGLNTEIVSYSSEVERLSESDVAIEKIMLSLRTSGGIESSWLRDNTKGEVVDRLLREGSLEEVQAAAVKMIRIPEDHFFVSDEIIRELI